MAKDNTPTQAIDVLKELKSGSDFSSREMEVLDDVSKRTGFKPRELLQRSTYWGKGVGASHWLGEFEGEEVVLKIQGVKPAISEIFMIGEFAGQNRSRLVRPPILLASIPWNDENEYEALIVEKVSGEKILKSQRIQSIDNIKTFMEYYQEYRANCLPQTPWLPKPPETSAVKAFEELVDASKKRFPNDTRRLESDYMLIRDAATVLESMELKSQFLHGHFSVEDLLYEKQGSKVVVLFSNLFWKWKYPFYDAVFGYHWFMYELSHVNGITKKQVENQRQDWFDVFSEVLIKSDEDQKLLKLALLERAIAGLAIDGFLISPDKPISEYLIEATRLEVKRLMKELG